MLVFTSGGRHLLHPYPPSILATIPVTVQAPDLVNQHCLHRCRTIDRTWRLISFWFPTVALAVHGLRVGSMLGSCVGLLVVIADFPVYSLLQGFPLL